MENPNAEQPGIPAKKVPVEVTEPPSQSDPVHKDPGTASNDSNPKPEEGSAVSPSTAEANESSSIKSSKSVRWSEQLVSESTFDSHPVPSPPQTGSGSFKERMNGVKDVLGRWGANVKEAAKKAETLAGNTWQHLKTNPSFADAAMGRIAHSTKILAEGGYDKIFRQTFETAPDEQLRSTYACYLSTSAGPVMGALYVSSLKLAFCSDNPLPYKNADKTEWSYYKVAIPLDQLKTVNSSSSRVNPSEKYIQIISVDSHEFWYMGFLNYEGAVSSLQEALVMRNTQSAV